MGKAERLLQLANQAASQIPDFFLVKGPGLGNQSTNAFVDLLRGKAREEFGEDLSEQSICGASGLAVDYYFRDEATIVEVALGLKNPNTEFEKDILKAAVAKEVGHPVARLFFIAKPGGSRKCQQPGRTQFIDWVRRSHRIEVEVHDLDHKATEVD
jgi:hypothetical protein